MGTMEIAYRYAKKEQDVRGRPTNVEAALCRLTDGNRAFADLLGGAAVRRPARRVVQLDPHDLGLAPAAAMWASQQPFAAVLGCSDARVPLELLFSEGPNDLFVIRVAGNGLGPDVLGSLRYALDHLGDTLKIIVVLGHSGCGAVSGAVDVFLDPGAYLSLVSRHPLRQILDRLLVVVRASARGLEAEFGSAISHHAGYRQALIETSIVVNAALAAYSAQQEIGTHGPLSTVYGVYLLETRRIWTPRVGQPDGAGLAPPPDDLAGFQELGLAMAKSSRVVSLLGT